VIFLRDADGELWIEVPREPGLFAAAVEFVRGPKYVEMWKSTRAEIEIDGPAVVEWETS
jgi:hypothetical protein